ncbi:hypothetical protein [Staphylococcus xylosus]|nr:hypothetical protein [Staphylococcus xylosus]
MKKFCGFLLILFGVIYIKNKEIKEVQEYYEIENEGQGDFV